MGPVRSAAIIAAIAPSRTSPLQTYTLSKCDFIDRSQWYALPVDDDIDTLFTQSSLQGGIKTPFRLHGLLSCQWDIDPEIDITTATGVVQSGSKQAQRHIGPKSPICLLPDDPDLFWIKPHLTYSFISRYFPFVVFSLTRALAKSSKSDKWSVAIA